VVAFFFCYQAGIGGGLHVVAPVFEVACPVDFGVVAEVGEVCLCGESVGAGWRWAQNPRCVAYTAL
jgi:hypothetical protein